MRLPHILESYNRISALGVTQFRFGEIRKILKTIKSSSRERRLILKGEIFYVPVQIGGKVDIELFLFTSFYSKCKLLFKLLSKFKGSENKVTFL